MTEFSFGHRIQMEVDNRKNEARTDLKKQDITVEVSPLYFDIIPYKPRHVTGIDEQEYCQSG